MKDWHKVKDLHTAPAAELAKRYGCTISAVFSARYDNRHRPPVAAQQAEKVEAPKVAEASNTHPNVTLYFQASQRSRIAEMAKARNMPTATLVRHAAMLGLDVLAMNQPAPAVKTKTPAAPAAPVIHAKKDPAPDIFKAIADKVERVAAQPEKAGTDLTCGMTPSAQAKMLVAKMIAAGSGAAEIARTLAGRGFTTRMVASILNRAGFRARGENLHNHATVLDLIFPAA